MAYRVSIIANKELRIGDRVQIDTESMSVKDADNNVVGYVANTAEQVAPHSSSASWLTNLLEKGKTGGKLVKEVWGILTEACAIRTSSTKLTPRFYAELFFVQEHQKKVSTMPKYNFCVGGVNAKNGGKPAVITALTKAQQDGSPGVLDMTISAQGDTGVFTYRVFVADNTNPAGELLVETEEQKKVLEKWFKHHDSLSAKTTGVTYNKATPSGTATGGIGYELSVEFVEASIDDFDDAIDNAVRHACGQDPEVREKVSYLVSEGVSKDVINLLLEKMSPSCLADLPEKPVRPYSGKSDILGDALAFSILGEHIRLIGDKGSGKNTLIQTICWLRNQPIVRIQGNVQLDKMDLLGCPQLIDGRTTFELSDVMKALRAGKTVVIDEANLIRPDVLGLLHSATDEARSVLVPGYGLVRLAPSAQVVYTMNEGYQGTNDMNEATVDRTPTFELGQELSLSALLAGYDKKMVKMCQKVSDEVRKAVSEGQLSNDAVTIRGYISACERAKFVPLKRALMYCVANKVQDSAQRQAIAGIINNVCP